MRESSVLVARSPPLGRDPPPANSRTPAAQKHRNVLPGSRLVTRHRAYLPLGCCGRVLAQRAAGRRREPHGAAADTYPHHQRALRTAGSPLGFIWSRTPNQPGGTANPTRPGATWATRRWRGDTFIGALPHTTLVVITTASGEQFWQRPTGRWALMAVGVELHPPGFLMQGYDTHRNEIGHWER
jgi:hypothetical protein